MRGQAVDDVLAYNAGATTYSLGVDWTVLSSGKQDAAAARQPAPDEVEFLKEGVSPLCCVGGVVRMQWVS